MAVERNEGNKTVQIEGTYTFPGEIDRVFAALTDADQLRHLLPGCQRLIQLGPAAPDGAIAFEARLKIEPDGGVATMTMTAVAARHPTHLRLRFHGRMPGGPIAGGGVIDLVAQDDFTLLAYVWEPEVTGVSSERQRTMRDAAQRYIRVVCERLASTLSAARAQTDRPAPARMVSNADVSQVTTPRGRIVRLTRMPGAAPLPASATMWAQRVAWMTTGVLIGVSAIGLLMGLARWLNDHER